jgi:type II secretory pathway component GspD/PulD (secretin)
MIDKFRKPVGKFLAMTGVLLAVAQPGRAQTATSNTLQSAANAATSPTLQSGVTTQTLRSGAPVPGGRDRLVVSNVTTASLKTIAQEAALRNAEVVPVSGKGLRLNFRGASLDTVLDYLGKAAGFTIVREATVTGRIDVYSEKSLSKEEAVQVLHTVLKQKGFGAVLSENTLKIVPLDQLPKYDIPVITGNDPAQVKKTDEMVTQIIPVRYANASQLIKNLEPLMPSYATMSSNDGSNAVVLTATRTDIRRMMEIIKALDTSLTTGSNLKVFLLNQASATDIAKLITDLFKPPTTSTGSNSSNGGRGGFPFPPMMFGRGGFGRGGGGDQGNSSSGGRATAYQVTAVADERTNAVVVSAPEEMLPTIEDLIKQIDQTIDQICEIRVFPLRYAEAQTMAQLINDVFQSQQNQNSSSRNGNSSGPMGFFMQRFMGGGNSSNGSSTASRRNGQTSTVYATPDIRTNAVVVNADKELMSEVAAMVEQLDNDPAKDRKVYVYPLQYADPQSTAEILESMFGTNAGSSRSSSSRNNSNNGGIFNQNNNNSSSRNNSRSSSGRSVPGGLGN